MTQKEREERATQLFCCMGEISDVYLHQAMLWRQKGTAHAPGSHRRNYRLIAVAAVAVVVTLCMFRVAVLVNLLDIGQGANNTPSATELTLNACLQTALESEAFRPVRADSIDFFDGSSRLVVQDTESGQLYQSRALTYRETANVQKELNTAHAEPVPAGAAEDGYKVWILCGDGAVLTPCLNPAPGNIGVAALFDYESERVPTETFLRLLASMT